MQRVGSYTVTETLGCGGSGTVYRAQRPGAAAPVALKLLLPGRAADEVQRRRFMREALALARVEHPHVVRVLDLGVHEETPFLVMEWVEGRTLQEVLASDGPLPLLDALSLARDLADALVDVHAAGLLHRDVKPANVLIRSQTGACVLTDFGLVRDLFAGAEESRLSHSGQFLGTPGYWSPEQARGELDRIGVTSDVYGLGATLYAMLTGAGPYGTPATLMEALDALQSEAPPPSRQRPGIPAAVDALVSRSLALDPARRFSSAAELRDALDVCLGTRPAPAARRGGVLAVCLGAAALAVLLLWRGTGPPPAVSQGPSLPQASGPGGDREGRPRTVTTRSGDPGAEVELEAGLGLFRAGRPEEARRRFEQATRLDPESARAWASLGSATGELGDWAAGLPDLERAVALDPSEPSYLVLRGWARSSLSDLEGAAADYEAALATDPSDGRAWANRGHLRARQGELKAGLADARRGVELAPELGAAWAIQASIRGRLGDLRGLVADLDRAIQLDPNTAWFWLERGVGRHRLGDEEGARADLERAVALGPRLPRAHFLRGLLHAYRGELAEASTDFTRSLELAPGDAETHRNRGKAREGLGDLLGAAEDYDRALELDRTLVEAWADRGLFRVRRGDRDGARSDFDQALKLRPDFVDALVNRGSLRSQQGDREGARADWSRALELDPQASWAPAIRSRLVRLDVGQ